MKKSPVIASDGAMAESCISEPARDKAPGKQENDMRLDALHFNNKGFIGLQD